MSAAPDREAIARRLLALDTETHRFQDGLLAPPGVCFSWADHARAWVELFDEGLERFARELDGDRVLAGANIAYDLAVSCAEPEGGRFKGDGRLLPSVFAKLARGEIFDVLIATTLDAIAGGHVGKDPNTGAPITHPPTQDQIARGKKGKLAKRYSLEIVTQLLLGRDNAKENDEYRKRYHELEHLPLDQWPETARVYPADDARNTYDAALVLVRGMKNWGYVTAPALKEQVTHWQFEVRAAFAMHLASVHGIRTGGPSVEALAAEVEAAYQQAREEFQEVGIYRANGSKNTARLKELVIRAYGGGAPCVVCVGSGKVPSPTTGKPINCKPCGGSGLEITDGMPRTPTGGISTSRDTLSESGDDTLERFATVSNTEKLRGTYIPFLRAGVDKPINVKSNPLLETGRASYEGLIQLLPRGSGVRECIIFRPGTVGCSVDYSAIELCALAEVCYLLFGESAMRDAINASGSPGILHGMFGARLAGADTQQFLAALKAKDPIAKNYRQAAKAGNFGFPGLMGGAKLALTKRVQENLRFCVITGRAPKCDACSGPCEKCSGQNRACSLKHCRRCSGFGAWCGVEKVTEWRRRPIPPMCVACIEYAEELRKEYLDQWPEVREYFQWVSMHPGVEESAAHLISVGTGFERGGLHASNLANHGFQHLASRGAKEGLWRVSRECYTDTTSPLYGSRPVVFAHDEILSELYDGGRRHVHDAAMRKAQIMVEAMREFIPDVTIEAEPALMPGRWLKDAEPAKDADGLLIPWEPKR